MKKIKLLSLIILCAISFANSQTFKFVTTIESVVSAGAGRSRMIVSEDDGTVSELELENLFSLVGIKFKNIKTNDSIITKKLSQMEQKGYKLVFVAPSVYGSKNETGIFLTRYIFRKD
ncbi:MAG: hypothetical protein EAZ27_03790 [Cytophagales bacterium]|nr:MAG: hypothetical protein EAZ27_03790 [Cytophagales bacterium]